MSELPPPTPPGWYPDPQTPGSQRYWDGTQWTGPSSPLPTPTPGGAGQPVSKVSGFAVTSMVLGIVGLVLFLIPGPGLILGLLAVVFGVVAIRAIRASQQSEQPRRGTGMAVAGIITGVIAALVFVFVGVVYLLGNRVQSSFEKTNSCIVNPNTGTC